MQGSKGEDESDDGSEMEADFSEESEGEEEEEEDDRKKRSIKTDKKQKKETGNSSFKYMAPIEVQTHLRLLWKHDGEVASLVYSSAYSEKDEMVGALKPDGWKIFFWKILPVMPSRFRPPTSGESSGLVEHPQNMALLKVLVKLTVAIV